MNIDYISSLEINISDIFLSKFAIVTRVITDMATGSIILLEILQNFFPNTFVTNSVINYVYIAALIGRVLDSLFGALEGKNARKDNTEFSFISGLASIFSVVATTYLVFMELVIKKTTNDRINLLSSITILNISHRTLLLGSSDNFKVIMILIGMFSGVNIILAYIGSNMVVIYKYVNFINRIIAVLFIVLSMLKEGGYCSTKKSSAKAKFYIFFIVLGFITMVVNKNNNVFKSNATPTVEKIV